MSDKPENPQAFPQQISDSGHIACPGMTLRDWFAGQALSIVAETYPEWQLKDWFGGRGGLTREEIKAKAAYTLADAMLRERAK